MRVVIAPDSFKGSLTSVQVATALADGWRLARPDDEILLAPLADGGEGTLVAIAAAGGWEWRRVDTTDPIGRPVAARWLRSTDGDRAVVELAEASGLSRLTTSERDPAGASTRGTGEVITGRARGRRSGRSRWASAAAPRPTAGRASCGPSAPRSTTRRVDLAGLDPRLAEVDLRIACDVSNPLLGPDGAAATYGPAEGCDAGRRRRPRRRARPVRRPARRGDGARRARRRPVRAPPAAPRSASCRSVTASARSGSCPASRS